MKPVAKDALAPAAVLFCAAPFVTILPAWETLLALVFLAWNREKNFGLPTMPSRPVKLAVLAGCAALLWREFGTLAEPRALAAVVIAYAAVFFGRPGRFYEYFVLAVLCALLILLHQALAPSPTALAHMTAGIFLVTGLLVAGASPDGHGAASVLKKNAVLCLQALPVVVLIMSVFPRFDGSFGGGRKARFGFADDLAPGDIAELAGDASVAFRVRFPEGRPPPPRDLYWRGTVLWDTDGFNWYNSFSIPESRTTPLSPGVLVQDIVVEPHAKRFLFAIDAPSSAVPREDGGRIVTLDGGLLQNRDVIFTPFSYRARSNIGLRWPDGAFGPPSAAQEPVLPPSWRKRALALPGHLDGDVTKLARSFSDGESSPPEIVAKALDYFANGGFSYTLKPSPMAGLKAFLFDEKRGFCEHFASAFAVLMRAAGIPARVVVGYQGAEYDPWGAYWLVRQNEAHAWDEVWIDGRGWVRVDPTAVVALLRLEEGSLASWLGRTGWLWDSLHAGRLAWDGFKFRAELALFGGGNDFPALFDFAAMTRGPRYHRVVGSLILVASVLFAAYFSARFWRLKMTRNRRVMESELTRHYRRLCADLERYGWPRKPYEGPLAYAERLKAVRTADAGTRGDTQALEDAFFLYARLRYGPDGADPAGIRRFAKLARAAIR